MNARRALILTTAVLLVAPVARSGHELPVYPSYYPHEIEIAAMAPERAAELMRAGKLHAYVGSAPAFTAAPGDTIGATESLGAFVIVKLNPESALAKDEVSACSTAGTIVRDMVARAGGSGLVVHPYPVTPFHGDYLAHADRAEAARQRILGGDAPSLPGDLRVRAGTALARGLVRPEWLSESTWDAAVEEVSASGLVADATVALNGWLGPRWARSGWFHAYRLLGGSMTDAARKQEMESSVVRLQTVAYASNVERLNLERELVGLLASGCRTVVAGYTVKREYFNAELLAGIENISFDALEGFSSPMFLRTVKLKDFPWNGWLQLGVRERPASAWNPIGGFTDEFGRLMWFAIADPAAIPSPYEATWTLNRISDVEASPRQ
jgi:hypothetical protein